MWCNIVFLPPWYYRINGSQKQNTFVWFVEIGSVGTFPRLEERATEFLKVDGYG